jgi:hypothetical protein
VYDRNYSWRKFQKEFPETIMKGVGWLDGWEWHVQSSGRFGVNGSKHFFY